MARGWESKSIEDQISSKQAEPKTPTKTKLTAAQIQQRAKREGLMLARSRTLTDLQSARDDRYRALLERTLAHLDAEIAALS